ncbi:putative N6-adenine-specific DNA methylase [Nitrosovibrio sp. Nv17]|nr:putative N6-adenine-specific DNA methylase [Nitrosovibrio sp. Nv17]
MLAAELEGLGASSVQGHEGSGRGGVRFRGDWRTCYRANLESRIASRILWRLACLPYASENDVYEATRALPWSDWFDPALTLRVYVAAIQCPLRSLDFITLRIKDAVCDAFRAASGSRPSVDTLQPDMRIHGFLDARTFSLYLDTSGDALFKRGFRNEGGVAPIRENLAAGILALAGWQPGVPLLDPMCGGGTFLLEAAQRSLDIAPGSGRRFAFEKFKGFDPGLWAGVRRTALARQRPPVRQPLFGSDLHGTAVAAARANLSAAGLAEVVMLKQANVLEISAPAASGILVANPPYGVRMGEPERLLVLYPALGSVLKKRFSGWRVYLFSADPLLPKHIRLAASRRIPLFNGARECRLLEYRMVAGGMRGVRRSDEGPLPA